MVKDGWVYCPICNNKTRTKIRKDTEAKNLPVFCPKCRNTTVMDIYGNEIKKCKTLIRASRQSQSHTDYSNVVCVAFSYI